MPIYQDITQLIGGTPLVDGSALTGGRARLLVKLERQNPAGSVKDRAALYMIRKAEERGQLKPGALIIEPTSGNTGIGLAAIAAVRGYRVVLTMPETMSLERRRLLAAYGAEIVLTPGDLGMQGAVDKARELAEANPGSFLAGQFDNPDNPLAHQETTGPEIWRDTEGQVDLFVAGVGTGGTLSGVGRYLKSQNPAIQVVAAEPAESPLLSGGQAGPHGIQGIGANFVPGCFDREVCDRIVPVATADALAAARRLAREHAILAGISSGAALWAAMALAGEELYQGKNIVALLPDTGERYLSTELFS